MITIKPNKMTTKLYSTNRVSYIGIIIHYEPDYKLNQK